MKPVRAGVTLAELLVVVAILVVLGLLFLFSLGPSCGSGPFSQTRVKIKTLELALTQYHAEHRVYPESGPDSLWNALARPSIAKREEGYRRTGPYIEPDHDEQERSAFLDAWGRPVHYQRNEEGYELWSVGGNGIDEYGRLCCGDDVASWNHERNTHCTHPSAQPKEQPFLDRGNPWLAVGLFVILVVGAGGFTHWWTRPRRLRLRIQPRAPPISLGLDPRPDSALRCAYCHSRVLSPHACRVCRVVLHEDCWPLLSKCPTLGCSHSL